LLIEIVSQFQLTYIDVNAQIINYPPPFQQFTIHTQQQTDREDQPGTITYKYALFSKQLFITNIKPDIDIHVNTDKTFTIQQPIQTDSPQQKLACQVPTLLRTENGNNTNTNQNVLTAIIVKRGVCPFGSLHTYLYINKYLDFNYFCIEIVSC
jgi:hypothetical protein